MRALAALYLVAAAASVASAHICTDLFARKSVLADTEELKCIALHEYSHCVADASLSLPAADADALYADLTATQQRLSVYDCSKYATKEPPRIQTRGNDLLFTTNPTNDIMFVRYRKDSANIAEIQDGVKGLKANVTAEISAATVRGNVQMQQAGNTLAGKIAGIQNELDLRFAVTSASVSMAAAATISVITRASVDSLMTDAIISSQARQDNPRSDAIAAAKSGQLASFAAGFKNFTDLQTEMNTDRNKTLLDSAAYVAQAKIDYNNIADDTRTKVNSAISTFNTKESAILAKLVYNVTNNPLEGVKCNVSETGKFRIYETIPGVDVDPGSAADDLNGARIMMDSYSHGSGYSISRNEVWNPQWAGNTIYRFSGDTYTFLGTFGVGRGEIMQCAGDDQDYFYGAHWGQQLVCKFGPWPNMYNQQWCWNTPNTASGVVVNSQFVFAVMNSNNNIFVLDRTNGANVKTINMQNWPGGGNYGVAMVGNRFWWLYPNQAFEYDLTDGSRRRNFGLADSPYAVFSAPDKFCFSPNSNYFVCYRTKSGASRAYGYICNGDSYMRA